MSGHSCSVWMADFGNMWTLVSFLFILLRIQFASTQETRIKIGIILDQNHKRLNTLKFAESELFPEALNNVNLDHYKLIDVSNNHQLILDMCTQMADGVFLMVVDNHPSSYGTVHSYAKNMHMPTIVPTGSRISTRGDYGYVVSLLPSTIEATVAILKHFKWNVVYYLFDSNDGLLRLQSLFESFGDPSDYPHRQPSLTIRARRIENVSDCYELLRKMDRMDILPPERSDSSPIPKRIILDLSSQEAYQSVLNQIVDVGMNREGYHYILVGLGIDELDLDTFIYGGVNITGYSIIDRAPLFNRNILNKAREYSIHRVGEITTDKALVIDTVHVIAKAVEDARARMQGAFRPRNSKGVGGPSSYKGSDCCNCSGHSVIPAWDGSMVLDTLKQVRTHGLTGNIEFDDEGNRENYKVQIHQLEHKQPLRHVGNWSPGRGLNTTLPSFADPEAEETFRPNRTLRVTTIKEEPFVQEKKTGDPNGAPLIDGKFYEGYCIDLARKIHEDSSIPFEYKIHLVKDGQYGKWDRGSGTWNGMIGELLRDDADLAIAPLTITEERQRVLDFTKPFMQTGISIMIKKPDKQKPGVFSFMYPLSDRVWLCVMVAFVAVSLVLFLVGRWSPYEWSTEDSKGSNPTNSFTLFNTFWFSLGALMQQGSDIFPRSYCGRIVGSAWWFFTLILISSYTANLAAFLTIEKLLPPIKSVDDLVRNADMEYGTLASGSSRSFFEKSEVTVYKKMWQHMSANEARVMKPSVKAGVESVQTSKGKYAFLLESTMNAYFNQRKPCNTMRVGENLDSKGYGIATPQDFYLRTELNLAVLHLREIGELHKLKQKWWYAKGECGTNAKDATTSALTLSNVSGIFHILVGGLVLAMLIALFEYFIHKHVRTVRQKKVKISKDKCPAVRIVKKQTLEALKEVGYVDRDPAFADFPSAFTSSAASPLVTFDTGATGTGQPKMQ